MNTEDVKQEVRKLLFNKLSTYIHNLEDNLAVTVVSEIKDYNPDWCMEDPRSEPNYFTCLDAIDTIVDIEVEELFHNANEEE